MNVLTVINKESFYLQDLSFEIVASKDDTNIKMTVDVDYKDINDETIEILQEVIF